MQFLRTLFRPRHQTAPNLYNTHTGDIFLPGAGNAVFEPAFQLPIIQLIGSAIYAGPPPSPLQFPQLRANKTAPVAGLGGPVAGQFIFQPLNVPDTTNGSQ